MISPCPGVTLRRLENGVPVVRIHYSANPTMTGERVASLRAKYTSEANWKQEMEIEYEAREGERLFPNYKTHVNDCEPFDCTDPEYWTWYMGCDPHGRTPHGFAWVACGSSGDFVIAQNLFSYPARTVKEYAETIKWLESDSDDKPWTWWPGTKLRIYKRVMDTHGKAVNSDEGEDYFKAYRKHGLMFYAAKKGQEINENSRDEINRLMLPQEVLTATGDKLWLPRLYVSTVCTYAIDQFENVRFPSGEVERASDEKPETYARHVVDPITYIFSERPRFIIPRKKARDTEEPIYESLGY